MIAHATEPHPALERSLVGDIASVGAFLAARGYRFTTVTPTTHARVVSRMAGRFAFSLRDIFGWNLPFAPGILPRDVEVRMRDGGLVTEEGGLLRSLLRFSSIDDRLYAHGAYPTTAPDAVFFGPDTYRFATAIRRHLRPCDLLVDLCAGSGAGGLEAGAAGLAERIVLADINPQALMFAAANRLLAADRRSVLQLGDLLEGIDERPDAIIANPPYLADPLGRAYRDGGGSIGTGLALRIIRESLATLAPAGQLLLYTGSPVVDGVDLLVEAARSLAQDAGAHFMYEEMDPDVFGEELEHPVYGEVERIAVVALSLTMPA